MRLTMKRLPGVWVAWPILAAALVACAATVALGPLPGIVLGLIASLLAALHIERRVRGLSLAAAKIAGGDRYAILPVTPPGPLADLACALHALRETVIQADALAVDQRRREAEARLHLAGRSFFTKRFRGAVEEVMTAFTSGSDRIGNTAADLAEGNEHMSLRVTNASAAAESASDDIHAVADAARDILARIKRSTVEIGASRQASETAASDLVSADATMRALAAAADRIGEVVGLIQRVARQTSLLALNASIEAVRAGESGAGFAVVASGVKKLAGETATATDAIAGLVRDIQDAVAATSAALASVKGSVSRISETDAHLREMITAQTVELDAIALRATHVAGEIAGALPDLRSAVGHVDRAGKSVLGTAEELIGRSQGIVSTVGRYFADLEHGAIKVGILHSLSGTMTASERPLQELLVMLIEKVNAEGGLLGRPLEAVIMNPRSDPNLYAAQARALLEEHGVAAIFGCWTSASRKAVLPVVEELNGLLFYPSQYEGEEESRNVFYLGATPRQQAIPAVEYLRAQGRKRFFLLGTDTVYPRITNAILKSYLDAHGVAAADIAEFYTPFNHKNWEETVAWIKRFGAGGDAAIVTTVSGDANIYLYRELARQGIEAKTLPAMTLSIGESELSAIAGPEIEGHLAAWSYLHEIATPENRAFIAAWRKFGGAPNVVTDDPMEATWIGFNMWREAVKREGATAVDGVRRALAGLRLRAPSGFDVAMDPISHHLHKPAVIGRMTADARIVPVWMSETLIPPEPWSPWLDSGDRIPPASVRGLALAS
jgi:urea transport system substrate-binding protein